MSKWIAEFELEDGDTMPEHMDLEYKGGKIDFHCRPMWIPVEEKLPEEQGLYLVTIKSGDKYYIDTDLYNTLYKKGFRTPNVTAWMPLPEGYKESEE